MDCAMNKLWCSVFLAFLLAACGGGSGNGNNDILNSDQTANDLRLMSNAISAIRGIANVGQVKQQSSLDLAAKRHADYLVNNGLTSNGSYLYVEQANGQWGGHYESMVNQGFTGATPQIRANTAGYAGTVNELAVFGAKSVADCVDAIENSAYHLVQLISPYVDMGLSFNSGQGGESACMVLLGVADNSAGQFPPADFFIVYPARGQTNVAPVFHNQAERPNPAVDLPVAGRPVLISFYNMANKVLASRDVVIHSFAMSGAGLQVPLRILAFPEVRSDGPTLVADSYLGAPGYVVALPITPLLANTTYTVNVSASVKGNVVTQQWTFSTGSI
jgi:hypothetical protein